MSTPELLSEKSWLFEKYLKFEHPLRERAQKLILISDYALAHIHLLESLLACDPCDALWSREDYFKAVHQLSLQLPLDDYMRQLRQMRHRHLLRLLLLEMAGLAHTEAVLQSWSDCADALILHALTYAHHSSALRYGIPRDAEGESVNLYTLAMGKLGGRELNYSSDIDLIFAFTASGTTDGAESISNQQFFSKVIQQLIQLMQQVTADGFVFRVDLRLRPNGDSGPLVSSLAAMETYYQEQGRDWERYAMVKARIIREDLSDIPDWFSRLITPFVYRRYVDFSVIESLRSMKAMIEREVQLNPQLDDIKRGKGGIREIEFIIQNVQLIRGGRLPQLRQQNALLALAALKQEKLLSRLEPLKQAYLYLRRLENVLQSLNDQQTHSLPTDPLKQEQVIFALGYASWAQFLACLHQHQNSVSQSFHSVLHRVAVYEDEKKLLTNQLASLWQGHVETTMAIHLLAGLGFEQAAHCYQMLHSFRHGPRCRRLPQGARMRLDRFMVLLLTELIRFPKTDKVLLQVLYLLENIVGRSAYLALLTENPLALRELLFWCAHSPFISSLLVQHPFLLEVLLDQNKEWRPSSRQELERTLRGQLAHHHDIETQEEILRQFKLTNWLLAARSEVYQLCHAVRIGQFLTDVAQVIVAEVLSIAMSQLKGRYPEIKTIKSRFAIIAYGKLGSREMNYSSDLDLVFLHAVSPEEEPLVTRLTQKMLHMLTVRSQAGVLYAVDTRLRPSGAAGLLVSRLDAFIAYQKTQAWTWEHQALLKARIVSGSSKIKREFLQLKQSVVALDRDKSSLRDEVLAMRAKIERHQDSDPIKHAAGGLLDLEFLVQFLLLNQRDPELARYTHTVAQIKRLFLTKAISKEQWILLKKAYQQYHHALHFKIIQPKLPIDHSMQGNLLVLMDALYH